MNNQKLAEEITTAIFKKIDANGAITTVECKREVTAILDKHLNQEPVGKVCGSNLTSDTKQVVYEVLTRSKVVNNELIGQPLYAHPLPKKEGSDVKE